MRPFEITYFSNNCASSGSPEVVTVQAKDWHEAINQFEREYPGKVAWSVDEVLH